MSQQRNGRRTLIRFYPIFVARAFFSTTKYHRRFLQNWSKKLTLFWGGGASEEQLRCHTRLKWVWKIINSHCLDRGGRSYIQMADDKVLVVKGQRVGE